jgi:hypothetical protein
MSDSFTFWFGVFVSGWTALFFVMTAVGWRIATRSPRVGAGNEAGGSDRGRG